MAPVKREARDGGDEVIKKGFKILIITVQHEGSTEDPLSAVDIVLFLKFKEHVIIPVTKDASYSHTFESFFF